MGSDFFPWRSREEGLPRAEERHQEEPVTSTKLDSDPVTRFASQLVPASVAAFLCPMFTKHLTGPSYDGPE